MSRSRELGFSLIEIVVVLAVMSLLAGAAATASLRLLRGNLKQQTLARLTEIMAAMIGQPTPGSHGYLGDMGELPDTSLVQLFVRGAQTPGVASPVDGVVAGYAGPYLLNQGDPARGFVDAWGQAIVHTPGVAQLRSLGPDRTLATADDIVHPLSPAPISGTITIVGRGLPLDGNPAVPLRSDEATVQVFYTRASDNTRALANVSYTGAPGAGVWRTDAALHSGHHSVVITGLDATAAGGRSYAGSVAQALVEIRGAAAFVTLALDESS
jgi:prepilin-type N-terminal cleavage/methylation domain-containing protein